MSESVENRDAAAKARIVIAEDSPVQALILRRALENNGYAVFPGKTGAEGLALVGEHKPALVISDVEMPDMNGFEFCRRIKSQPETQSIPVILCTSLTQPADIIKGMEAGADGYVTKPYDERFLIMRVEAMLANPPEFIQADPVTVQYAGETHVITASRRQILNMLLSTYENTVKQNSELIRAQLELKKLNQQVEFSLKESERLLLSILPRKVAEQLKKDGQYEPAFYDSVTVLFTDFKGFTLAAEKLSPKELLRQLDASFSFFDSVTERYGLEKLKTIGDSYMCAGGIPETNRTHAIDAVMAALEMQEFMFHMGELRRARGLPFWECRLGIHTGPLIAGVVGTKKFAYDVWGDTVNTASRMESSGETGKVNVSHATYELIHSVFECEYRGKVKAKNKGDIDMYFVHGLKPDYSIQGVGQAPNQAFKEYYEALARG